MTARRSGLATVSHDSTPEIDSVAAGHDDTLDHMVQLETAADVHLAVEALPAAQRRVLELRYFAELELGKIALVVGVPLGTVKSRVNRALQSLRNSQHIKQESHIV
jgi:RNA polymerase sigma factor (sigma-70 family)